jgi:hypothetical protein
LSSRSLTLFACLASMACEPVLSEKIIDPHVDDVCSAALRGTKCDFAVPEGDISRCEKQPDGSLLCDSPRVGGPSLPPIGYERTH